tara:strand:- start:3461 stop:4096 length:636 start_codon:yes stop_codon:yes gene_type:complete
MGYLDNSSITVDAILTKKGRELLSKGQFNITQFALSDDEIDYSLYNINHPDGSQYAGQAIENMPILEAFPDELNMMRHKLITLNRGSVKIPIIANITDQTMTKNIPKTLTPATSYMDGQNTTSNYESKYSMTIADRRLFTLFNGGRGNVIASDVYSDTTAVSAIAIGNTFTLKPTNSDSLFGTKNSIITTATIEGLDTGAKITISITINKV